MLSIQAVIRSVTPTLQMLIHMSGAQTFSPGAFGGNTKVISFSGSLHLQRYFHDLSSVLPSAQDGNTFAQGEVFPQPAPSRLKH